MQVTCVECGIRLIVNDNFPSAFCICTLCIEKRNMICTKMVRCYDFLTRQCKRPAGHQGGCNPFSDACPSCGKKGENCTCGKNPPNQ